jgi:hypothetical protein
VPRDEKSGKPMTAIVLNINGATDIINVGKASCRIGDTLLAVRITAQGPLIDGTLQVLEVYNTDATTVDIRNWNGIRPEDYIFVISRSDSNISLANVSFSEK